MRKNHKPPLQFLKSIWPEMPFTNPATNHWFISCTSHTSSESTMDAPPWSEIANADVCLSRSTQLTPKRDPIWPVRKQDFPSHYRLNLRNNLPVSLTCKRYPPQVLDILCTLFHRHLRDLVFTDGITNQTIQTSTLFFLHYDHAATCDFHGSSCNRALAALGVQLAQRYQILS